MGAVITGILALAIGFAVVYNIVGMVKNAKKGSCSGCPSSGDANCSCSKKVFLE